MPSQTIQGVERISKTHGRIMVAVGVFFDLIPLLLILAAIGLVMYGLGGSFEDAVGAAQGSTVDKLKLVWNGAASITGGVATAIFAGPLLYAVGSFFSLVFGYFIFTLWFLFKGVNIWSCNNVQRILVNGIAVVVEAMPILNMLPGITLMVWRHVKVTQVEDRIKNKESAEKTKQQLMRLQQVAV